MAVGSLGSDEEVLEGFQAEERNAHWLPRQSDDLGGEGMRLAGGLVQD
jgi:hypothetical protein